MGVQGKITVGENGWQRVLVRHVVKTKRGDLDLMDSLLRTPFESKSSATIEGGSEDITSLCTPTGRWMLAARFSRTSWLSLTSNAGTAEEIFKANASSRRLEVALLGCDPEGSGWSFHLKRAGKSIAEFSQSIEAGSTPTFKAKDVQADLLGDCPSAEQAFEHLCSHFDVTLPDRHICATETECQVVGSRGKPVKTGLRGYIVIIGPEITKGESKASTALAKAINRCDVEGMRKAIEQGASVHVLPDTSVSPLRSILYKCEQAGWKDCAELLLQHGAPVNGRPQEEPPILACATNYTSENMGLKMLKFLVAHGADVNATNPSTSETVLSHAVIQGYVDIVQFLMEHSADPNIETRYGWTPVEWLRSRLEKDRGVTLRAQYAQILNLLTGETVEEPEVPELSDDLKAENERFRLYHKARFCLEMIPQDVDVRRIKTARLANAGPFEAWRQELLDAGFELSGHFVQRSPDRVTGSAYTNSKLCFDAILSSGGELGNNLRCDISAHRPDGTVSTVTNYKVIEDPDISVHWLEYNEHLDASPAQLVSALRKLIGKKKVVTIDAESFETRQLKSMRRLLKEYRDQAAEMLETPLVLPDDTSPRFERVGCFLDFFNQKDPAYSSKNFTESALERIEKLQPLDKLDNERSANRTIHSAAELLVMRHLQFAGAPDNLDFASKGSDLANTFFQSLATKWSRKIKVSHVESLNQGLLLAAMTGRWDTFEGICNSVKVKLASPGSREAGDVPIDLARLLVVVASHFRERKLPKINELEQAVQKSRSKHPRLLLDVWRAIREGNQTAFDAALIRSLEYFEQQAKDEHSSNNLLSFVTLPESLFNLVAMKQGMEPARLPQNLADLIITPDSVDMPK